MTQNNTSSCNISSINRLLQDAQGRCYELLSPTQVLTGQEKQQQQQQQQQPDKDYSHQRKKKSRGNRKE